MSITKKNKCIKDYKKVHNRRRKISKTKGVIMRNKLMITKMKIKI